MMKGKSYMKDKVNKYVLSREFIDKAKNEMIEEFKIGQIELVGSYRRGEANESSDVDFIILDESYPKGLAFIRMIGRFEELLGKEVGIVTRSGLLEDDMKKQVLYSMIKDIEEYS